ncbi:MAG TPA: hypothetical protein VGM41_12340 [Chitinophagaceae bacterium]|jgi:hypothetical protein
MEYRIAKAGRITVVILAIIFVVGGGAFIVSSFAAGAKTPLFFFILGLILAATGVYSYLDTMKTKLTIDDDSITLQKAFSTRSLLRSDIKGYRQGEKNIVFIIPKEGAGKQIQLSGYFERRKEIMVWLKKNYPDVDTIEYEAETKTILANENFGVTEGERENNLAKARKVSTWASTVGIGISFWVFIYPKPYEPLLIALAILPWVGVYITWYFKGLVRFDTRKKSAWPSVSFVLYFPALALLLRAILDYDLYIFGKIWTPLLASTLIVTLVFFTICKKAVGEEKSKALVMGVGALIAGCYSFGLIVLSNCYYDSSKPDSFQVQVTGKHITTGKHTSYYLTLSPWGRFSEEKDQSVRRSFYEEVQTGQSLHVHLHEGRWHIPWYFVME